MTTQDTWNIKIGGGFDFPNRKSYPSDRLIAFLNLKPTTNKEVANFCTKYQFIPRNYQTLGLIEAFKNEQEQIGVIFNKIYTKEPLDGQEFNKLNENLSFIRKGLSLASQDDIENYNRPLSGSYNKIPKGQYPIDVFIHGDTTVSLWEELSNLAIRTNKLARCTECKSIYRPNSKHKRKYCDNPNCGNKARQDDYRKRHNLQK